MALTQISTNGIKDANVNTADIAADAVTSAKIADDTIGAEHIIDNSVQTAAIQDEAVTLAKLPHGTSSNDGKFLRANNGADPTFETITGTTINNNANNRVITGSGTANTLNGESTFTYDGSGNVGVTNSSGATALTFTTPNNTDGGIYFTDGSDGNKGAISYLHTDDSMKFRVNGTNKIVIDSSGNTGIGNGAYSIGAPLEVRNPAGTTPSTGHFVLLRLCAQHNSNRGLSIGTGRPTSGNQNDGGVFYNAVDTEGTPSGYSAQHVFQRAGNNVMVLGYQGNNFVGIGTDYPDRQLDVVKGGTKISRFQQTTNNTGEDHTCITLRHAAAISGQNGVGMIFQNSGGSVVGKIDFGQSTTQYRTSSDYRLKENAVSISDGITRLKTLKPYRFNFITEPDKTVDGFFAHEVTAVPEAISGTKDEVDANNNPVYQGIDQSKLVPLLTAALQEAITKIETLETKVAALEAA